MALYVSCIWFFLRLHSYKDGQKEQLFEIDHEEKSADSFVKRLQLW